MNPKVQGATFIKGFPVTYHGCYGYSEVEVRPIIEMRPIIENLRVCTYVGYNLFVLKELTSSVITSKPLFLLRYGDHMITLKYRDTSFMIFQEVSMCIS